MKARAYHLVVNRTPEYGALAVACGMDRRAPAILWAVSELPNVTCKACLKAARCAA
jgi:hypothetical protein